MWGEGRSRKQGVRHKEGVRKNESNKEEITQEVEVNVAIFKKEKSKLYILKMDINP